jgi:hypothetical protein
VFALGPSWRGGRGTARGVARPGYAGDSVESERGLDMVVASRRAQLERIAAESAQRQAQTLEQVTETHLRALRDSAWAARAELERVVADWEQSGGRAAVPARATVETASTVEGYRKAIEAFERIRRIQQRSLEELARARAEGLEELAAAKQEVDAHAAQHLARIDAAGEEWLHRLDHAGRRPRGRSRQVSPPVVGILVAVSLAVGAVVLAVAGDDRSSEAGPQLRVAAGEVDPPTTTAPPAPPVETAPADTTAPAGAAPPAPEAPQPTVTPVVAPLATAPPVVQTAPPVEPQTLPPVVTFPSYVPSVSQVCAIVPSLC